MGDFKLEINGVGGHGCDRAAKEGDTLKPCGSASCPDCWARGVALQARRLFGESFRLDAEGKKIARASFTHWPGTSGTVIDDLSEDPPKRAFNDFYNTRKV